MRVAGEIGKDLLGAAEGRLGVNDPVCFAQGFDAFGESARFGKRCELAEEAERVLLESGLEAGERGREMNLKGADILKPQTIRGAAKIAAELRNGVEVGSLGRRRRPCPRACDGAEGSSRPSGNLLFESGLQHPNPLRRRPITRHRRTRRDQRLRSIPFVHTTWFS